MIRFLTIQQSAFLSARLILVFMLACFAGQGVLANSGFGLHDIYDDTPDPSLSFNPSFLDTLPPEDGNSSFLNRGNNPFDLNDPGIIKQTVEYDPVTGQYILTETIGENNYRNPTYLTFEEYMKWQTKQQEQAYFNNLTGIQNDYITFTNVDDPIEQFDITSDLINRLFGGTAVTVEPKGNIDITLGMDYQKVLNPNLPLRQQKRGPNFDFDMDINMGLNAKIGEKLDLNFNYNTNATFSFENKFKLKFDSEAFSEDDIIKNIEAGDVSLPLNSSLIQGNQSLFGLKTELQFGKLFLTTVISQQRSEQESVTVQNGAQWQEFEIRADEYDENRHFLLSHYNRTTFAEALEELPQIHSLFRVTRAEVWVTSINNEYQDLRQIVAIGDLAEYSKFTDTSQMPSPFFISNIDDKYLDKTRQNIIPDNRVNRIYQRLLDAGDGARQVRNVQTTMGGTGFFMSNGRDYEQRRARKLSPNRYTLIPELGVISLDAQLRPDEVLAIAYEYTYNGQNFQVGEFSSDVPEFSAADSTGQVIFVKMLKSSTQQIDVPMYDLMMKNFYSIGAYQASEEDFQFDIYYDDAGNGFKRYLPELDPYNKALLSAFNLDQLNFYGDPAPDGFFDFIPGVTINTRTGKVMFPVLEPFGKDLQDPKGLALPDPIYEKYKYTELYRQSIIDAREYQEKNRFVLKGSYKSSVSNEISLGSFNLPQGSVTVRSGGVTLRENVDYVVDYQIGRVRIINDAYAASGAPINVSFEDRTLFGFNRQSMLGLRADYKLSKKVNIGGTFMKLWERPFTPKVNYGDDPINNNIYGLDFAYSDKAPWLTKAIDALPGISTKEESNIDFYVEGAVLKPGHSGAINVGDDEGGVVYIDDFEGSSTGILLANQINRWSIASVPQHQRQLFPEGELNDDVRIGANRALLNWYRIEGAISPDANDPYQKYYRPSDIFRGTNFANNFIDFRTFDIRYYPRTPGPYNFDIPNGYPGYTAGLLDCNMTNGDIELAEPESRWAGIMREIDATNFQAANVQALEFWVLNPFINTPTGENNGEITFQIGNISEDILKDGLAFYENSLPVNGEYIPTDTTELGQIPSLPPVIFAFSNDPEVREQQDLGLDGYTDSLELVKFSDYSNALLASIDDGCVAQSFNDPDGNFDLAHDNYKWFADDVFNGLPSDRFFDRFKHYNGQQGNSPIVTTSSTFSNSFTSTPDAEDVNEDGSSERSETYFEYKIPFNNNRSEIDQSATLENKQPLSRYITDTVNNGNGEIWYRFKVPLSEHTFKVGSISDFRSIKFIRMITSKFEEPVTLRFAKMEFTRNQWRKLVRNLNFEECGDRDPGDLDLNVVNIEEHGGRSPFNYVLPPGIDREENFQSAFRNTFLNEQSLSLELCDHYCGMLGVYKTLGMNMREYERLKLFAHIESTKDIVSGLEQLKDGDISLVIRMGSDYTNNFYEYLLPLDFSEDGEDPVDPEVVWKDSNRVDLVLQELKNLKLRRPSAADRYSEPYIRPDGMPAGTISVIGNPNLGDVNTMFLGLQVNNDDFHIPADYCANAWLNELRLVGLNESGGAAAIGRLDMQLADLGNVALSGNISGIGWGSIDKQLLERQQEKIVGYDAATNLELSKFIGDKSRLKLPFFAQYSNTTRTPKYDPYDRDLTVKEKKIQDGTYDLGNVQDKTVIKTVSMNNVRLEKSPKKKVSLPWDVSNFSASVTHTTTEHSDPILSQDDSKQQTGSLDYRYNTGSKPIQPFKKLIKTDKWIKFIKDINFNPLPSQISIRNSLDRRERNRQFRVIGEGDALAQATSRQFLWNRDYRLGWDFTKSIKFNYFATNQSAVDELDNDGLAIETIDRFDPLTGEDLWGGNTRPSYSGSRKEYRNENLKDLGRSKNFDQSFDLSYKLPFSKFGILDWLTTDLRYSANYNWTAAAFNNRELGNSISNGSDGSIRVNMNFERLYNKSKLLASVNRGKSKSNKKVRDNSKLPDVAGKDGKKSGKKKDTKVEASNAARILLRPLMMIRRGRFNYTETHSSYVPGINKTPELLGMSSGFDAPGWEYIAGVAPDDQWLRDNSNGDNPNEGYFVNHDCINQEFQRTFSRQLDAQVSLEPVPDFKIDVKIDQKYSLSESSLFKFQPEIGDFDFGKSSEFGSYSISYLTTKTLFQDGEANINALFGTFKQNLSVVSTRVEDQYSETNRPHEVYTGYSYGFGPTQQEVIVPAFIAAYRGEDASKTNLNVFNETPLPNWTITYNGLTKIPWFKERFTRFSLSHTYNSTLTVNSFNTDLRRQRNVFAAENINPITLDYYSRLTIPQVTIAEGMSPIIKLDITTVNEMSINFELGKNRTLSLDPDNQQINETRSTSWAAGFGYTLKNVYLGFIPGAKKQKKRPTRGGNSTSGTSGANAFEGNTIKISCDFSLKDDRTLQHLWGLDVAARPTRGQRAMTISPAIDYTVNEYLTMRLFFDYRSTEPYTELSYPITNARGGLRLRFALK